MPSISYTSRRELEEHSFSPAVTLLVPVAAIVLQVLLSKLYWRFSMLDLPLIVAIFFSVSRRSPAVGTLTGAAIGLVQDALTGRPIGVNGMAKSVIGYIAASIGIQVDVDNLTTRVVMNFAFSMLNSVLLFLIGRRLLGQAQLHMEWIQELLRALANTVIAIPVFLLLDHTKRAE
ncbi:rod shape-determining protein MreD [Edaphobacter modestus]|uniref:Rod shape-determining protein MreD n=1 Tax=Edaphobacter modestus TaxID=388466 RepID=A0A4Q7YZH1_9BACT|nr:rod shape-determining protein MreD [Edaphobacter modestus]RZU42633.1 rod shape-determining protein MreD [Edaphobacter modestus]